MHLRNMKNDTASQKVQRDTILLRCTFLSISVHHCPVFRASPWLHAMIRTEVVWAIWVERLMNRTHRCLDVVSDKEEWISWHSTQVLTQSPRFLKPSPMLQSSLLVWHSVDLRILTTTHFWFFIFVSHTALSNFFRQIQFPIYSHSETLIDSIKALMTCIWKLYTI